MVPNQNVTSVFKVRAYEALRRAEFLGHKGAVKYAEKYWWYCNNALVSAEQRADAMATLVNIYYTAAGHFHKSKQGNGFLNKILTVGMLLHAWWFAEKLLRANGGVWLWSPGALHGCMATLGRVAEVARMFRLTDESFYERCVACHYVIMHHGDSDDEIKSLSIGTMTTFPRHIGSQKDFEFVEATVTRLLAKGAERTERDSQVLARLLRATERPEEALAVARAAGLPDQVIKAGG